MPTLLATHENRVTNLFRAIFCTEQILDIMFGSFEISQNF